MGIVGKWAWSADMGAWSEDVGAWFMGFVGVA